MNKQVIPSSWHCNGVCAGLQMETFVPVLLDSKKSNYLQRFFQFTILNESSNDSIFPSSFPPISTFFNCSCLNIKRLLSGKSVIVKFPVIVDFMQIKLFYCDNLVRNEYVNINNNENDSPEKQQEVDECSASSTVSPNVMNKKTLIPSDLNKTKPTTSTNTAASHAEVTKSQRDTIKAFGDISSSEDSDDDRLEATILQKMNEIRTTTQQSPREQMVKSETEEHSSDHQSNIQTDSKGPKDEEHKDSKILEKMEVIQETVSLAPKEDIIEENTDKNSIEDLIVYNTDAKKKDNKKTWLRQRTVAKKSVNAEQNSRKRMFMLETLDALPKKKVGRPSKAYLLAKKTAEIKFKNLANPVLRKKNDPSETSVKESSVPPTSLNLSGSESVENDVCDAEKPTAPVEHPPIVERSAIDLVRRKLELLKEKRSKEPESAVESLFGEIDEEKPLFAMDDGFYQDGSNVDLTILTNCVQDTSSFIYSPPDGPSHCENITNGMEPSSPTSSISSEGALVVHDILFDDL